LIEINIVRRLGRHAGHVERKKEASMLFRTLLAATAVLGLTGLGACSPEGSAEKTGEDMDSAIEEATQGEVNRGDGALENAGEAIDQATGRENDDPVDAVNDATDDNPNTQP